MKLSNPYKKIACSFYDQLETYAVLRTKLNLVYKDINNQEKNKIIQIKTLETKQGEEFMITEDDFKLRLDLILSLVPV